MKARLLIAAGLTAACLVSLPHVARAAPRSPNVPVPPVLVKISASISPEASVGVSVHIPADEIHHGDLIVILGDAVVEGTVTGEVIVILGSLDLSGTAVKGVVSVLTRTTVSETARIGGDLVNVGWSMSQAEGSRDDGETIDISFMSFSPFADTGWSGWSSLVRLFYMIKLFKLAVLFVVVLLISALVPRRLAVIAGAFPMQWGWALLAGLLAYAGLVVACVILGITLIGIPLALLLGFTMKLTKWVGLAALFFLIGQTIGRNAFHRDLSHLASVLGGYVAFAVLSLVPFLGDTLALVMNLAAVGIVIVTRFGTVEAPAVAAVPAGPAPSPPGTAAPPDPETPPVVEPPTVPPPST